MVMTVNQAHDKNQDRRLLKNCMEAETSTTTKEPAILLQRRIFQALWKECVYMVDKKRVGGEDIVF